VLDELNRKRSDLLGTLGFYDLENLFFVENQFFSPSPRRKMTYCFDLTSKWKDTSRRPIADQGQEDALLKKGIF
jgi:hypothetical protein